MAAAPHIPGSRLKLGLALFSLYVVWGSTYLAMRVAMLGFPAFRMASYRFLVAGAALMLVSRLRGTPLPTLRQWRNAALVGTLLLACGNGGVAYAEQTVSSGLAALMVSAVPLWVALFGGLWGKWPAPKDWMGLALGTAGIVVLNLGSELRGSPAGAGALVFATAAWAFGSMWSRKADLPRGSMAAAAQMLAGGVVLLGMSALRGERMPATVPPLAIGALAYLVVFGSLVAYSAYLYLLARATPAVATSYAYVNPVVALLLGAALLDEHLPPALLLALPLIVGAVALVLRPPGTARRPLPRLSDVGGEARAP